MTAHAAVPGQPVPVMAEAGQRAGEMRAQGAVDRRHFIIFKEDRILLIGGEAFHHQIGDDRRQMVARTVQRTTVDHQPFRAWAMQSGWVWHSDIHPPG